VVGQLVVALTAVGLGLVGPRWPEGSRPALLVAASALGVLAVVVLVVGSANLGPALTPFPTPREDAPLVESGVYRLVRHPLYAGLILASLSWSLASSPLALLGAAALFTYLDVKSSQEERWLVERHPRYLDYRRRTRWKFVPGIR
jgi:protein-S-isoprenylcysteine O-methyltransferase Ste14